MAVICEQCQSSIQSSRKGRRFCDRKCASLFREANARDNRQQIQCPTCKENFWRPYGERRVKLRFCSRKCAQHVRKGNSPEALINGRLAIAAHAYLKRSLRHTGREHQSNLRSALGYGPDDLRTHLERQFEEGMTWANYGQRGWHIDHRKPISTFPRDTDIKAINALSNIRPLWEPENCARLGTAGRGA